MADFSGATLVTDRRPMDKRDNSSFLIALVKDEQTYKPCRLLKFILSSNCGKKEGFKLWNQQPIIKDIDVNEFPEELELPDSHKSNAEDSYGPEDQ